VRSYYLGNCLGERICMQQIDGGYVVRKYEKSFHFTTY
jgi:hypothetical protein